MSDFSPANHNVRILRTVLRRGNAEAADSLLDPQTRADNRADKLSPATTTELLFADFTEESLCGEPLPLSEAEAS